MHFFPRINLWKFGEKKFSTDKVIQCLYLTIEYKKYMFSTFFSPNFHGLIPVKKHNNILGGRVWRHFFMACSKLEAMSIYVVKQACGYVIWASEYIILKIQIFTWDTLFFGQGNQLASHGVMLLNRGQEVVITRTHDAGGLLQNALQWKLIGLKNCTHQVTLLGSGSECPKKTRRYFWQWFHI